MENDKKYGAFLSKDEVRKTAITPQEAVLRLLSLVRILRNECPWDKEQTHESLLPLTIEEAYEVCDAVYSSDFENLNEELGDLLLHIVFHADIAQENQKFDFVEVCNGECDKMIRRHPHIFNDLTIKTVDKVLEKWENVKQQERKDKSLKASFDAVPRSFPALLRAVKIQKRAANPGFDWSDIEGPLAKVHEEFLEFTCAYREGECKERIFEEYGDLLFAVVNLARFVSVDPEQSLNAASDKFVRRFLAMEEEASNRGESFEELSLEEMDCLWDAVKAKERERQV